MGLDMYLEKRTYVQYWEHTDAELQYDVTVTRGGNPTNINPKKVKYIIEEAGYWRKFNALHGWFVENVQDGVNDCGDYDVSNEKLEEVLDICKEIKADNSKALELLPHTSGFFFGGEEIDEWYLNHIDYTIELLEELVKDKSADYYYNSSW